MRHCENYSARFSGAPIFKFPPVSNIKSLILLKKFIIALDYHMLICMSINLFFMGDLAPEMAN